MDLTNEHCGYSKKASKNMGEMNHIAHLNKSRNVFSIQDISGTTCRPVETVDMAIKGHMPHNLNLIQHPNPMAQIQYSSLLNVLVTRRTIHSSMVKLGPVVQCVSKI
uniref:Uncharacterized protein n=1 Tax=Magallana gigas TaxID=29159 RepID=K1QFY9_MAGGI